MTCDLRLAAWAGSAIFPIVVAAPVLMGILLGEDLESGLRTAVVLMLPASVANVIAAWAVALRRDASRPRDTWGAFWRAVGTFALALPFYGVGVAALVLLQADDPKAAIIVGAIAGMMAAILGTLPMIALQWLLFHFTLPRATA